MPPKHRELATVDSIGDLRTTVAAWRGAGQKIALVPTMGALHDGHLALVRAAQADCERVVATIFVNPLQFNAQADLDSYPATWERDVALLSEIGTDLLYAPRPAEMYPEGFATKVSVSKLTECLCGVARPGHFEGVATVVAKLLLQAAPDAAYFGEKDYQQLLVVRRMARDLDIPTRIEAVATVREPDGLALSSRNFKLSAEQRRRAPHLCRIMREVAAELAAGAAARPSLDQGTRALRHAGFDRIDYLEMRDGTALGVLQRAEPGARLFAAAWLGDTRLIDNISVV
jgi:pantoate--beta-alanine ligase